ncbi:MAG: sensor histidine kinase [Candidatus Bipolaricaulia bacterium]
MTRLLNWKRWRDLTVHEQVAWTRRILPVTIFIVVFAIQAWINWAHPNRGFILVHFGIEIFVYAMLGPLITWYILLWIEHQVREKEHMEIQLRQQEQRLLQIRDEVSAQIASDLHDSLGPKLFALALKADVCKKLLRSDPCQVEQELSMISATLQESIREVRRAVYALRPIELERLGLCETLRKIVTEYEELNQTKLELHICGEERRLPHEIEVGLYYIVQEALHNVRKHAGAQKVTMGLDVGPRVVCLTVRDDGKGFDPAKTPEGIGLRHMRERALRLGGTFSVHAAPGEGTELRVCLPVPQGASR